MNWLKTWWCTRVQKDIATALVALAAVDLTPYSDDIHDLIPWPHWHALLRVLGGIAVYWRATQVSKPKGDGNVNT